MTDFSRGQCEDCKRDSGPFGGVKQPERTRQVLQDEQQELARAARAATAGALSASIAHEVNQPLGALVLSAETCLRQLRRDPPNISAAIRAAERIVSDSVRASEIVRQTRCMLVKGSQLDEVIDLRQMLNDVGLLLDREITSYSARLRTEIATDLPMIKATRVEMQQVMINLILNGLHAMEDAPCWSRELILTVDRFGASRVRISVKDRGVGIKEEDLPRLFEPFFTTKVDGTGMGLSICRLIVESRGGCLTARNHEGGGAIFEIVFPSLPTPDMPAADCL